MQYFFCVVKGQTTNMRTTTLTTSLALLSAWVPGVPAPWPVSTDTKAYIEKVLLTCHEVPPLYQSFPGGVSEDPFQHYSSVLSNTYGNGTCCGASGTVASTFAEAKTIKIGKPNFQLKTVTGTVPSSRRNLTGDFQVALNQFHTMNQMKITQLHATETIMKDPNGTPPGVNAFYKSFSYDITHGKISEVTMLVANVDYHQEMLTTHLFAAMLHTMGPLLHQMTGALASSLGFNIVTGSLETIPGLKNTTEYGTWKGIYQSLSNHMQQYDWSTYDNCVTDTAAVPQCFLDEAEGIRARLESFVSSNPNYDYMVDTRLGSLATDLIHYIAGGWFCNIEKDVTTAYDPLASYLSWGSRVFGGMMALLTADDYASHHFVSDPNLPADFLSNNVMGGPNMMITEDTFPAQIFRTQKAARIICFNETTPPSQTSGTFHNQLTVGAAQLTTGETQELLSQATRNSPSS